MQSMGSSIPNSTKKSTISEAMNSQINGKPIVGKGKLSEMMIED